MWKKYVIKEIEGVLSVFIGMETSGYNISRLKNNLNKKLRSITKNHSITVNFNVGDGGRMLMRPANKQTSIFMKRIYGDTTHRRIMNEKGSCNTE